ncbi:MAG TPA: ABC transporter permease [Candidatus Polarisedimenticolia bacterium]|nr:ABC transporter permease [Candidatus Polarisedimenticolia bacterium]
MKTLGMDLRFGLRMLLRTPAITLVAIITLAIGIGGNTALFSIVDAVLLRPLAYRDPERLVVLRDKQPAVPSAPTSYPEYLAWKADTNLFEQVAAMFGASGSLTGEGEPESLPAMRGSAALLPMLGVAPILGRTHTEAEDDRGGERVVTISEGLWRRRFAADPAVIGKPVTLNGEPWTVIGVLPRSFSFGRPVDLIFPLRLDTENAQQGMHFLSVFARLRPGLPYEQAQRGMEAKSPGLATDLKTDHVWYVVSLKEWVVGDTSRTLALLGAALGFVLLIACANVAGLLLARAAARRQEVAIRRAIGASRADLVRQFLTESLILAVAGGVLGCLLAVWGVDLFKTLPEAGIPRARDVSVGPVVLLFSLGLSLLTGLLFGIAPALETSASTIDPLKGATGLAGDTRRVQRMRGLLVVGQVSLSLLLLVGAGLLTRSLVGALRSERGFDVANVITMELDLPARIVKEPADQARFYSDLLDRLRGLPGVEAAATCSHLPLSGSNTNGDVLIEGRPAAQGETLLSELRRVSEDYFTALRIPVLRGRAFTSRDAAGAPAVAIVNQAFVDRFLAGQDPIGRRVDAQWDTHGWQEIVGVVGNIKHDALDAPPLPELYVPFRQVPMESMVAVVRAPGDPTALASLLRREVYAVRPDQPVRSMRTMDEVLSASIAPRRLTASMVGAFAWMALFLASIGIYGLLAFWVSERRREIGLRMALGARPRQVLGLVVSRGLLLTGLGLGIGLAASAGLTRLLKGFLYGVGPSDPVTLFATPLLLGAVALFASWLPARRAMRIDPAVALRSD